MPQQPSPVIDAVMRFRAQLDALDARQLDRLISNYRRAWARLEAQLNSLIIEIGDKAPTKGQLARMQRYDSLISEITQELAGLQSLAMNEVELAVGAGVSLGTQHALALISTTITGTDAITGAFNTLPTDAVETALGMLDPNGALFARLRLLSPYWAEQIANAITQGITLGNNPRKIAALVQKMFSGGLTDSLRFVRTAQLWSYREASRAIYIANSDVVGGWIWHATFDSRVCASCIAMHGTEHTNDEALNDHHNGRCAMIPIVEGYGNPVTETGEEWFRRQPRGVQRRLLGPGKLEAWEAGRFEFSELTTEHTDSVYGPMRVERSLKDLLGELSK